jgi:hypothetical protein
MDNLLQVLEQTYTKIGTGTVLAPDVNEVRRVMGINLYNSGGGPVELEYGLNGVLLQNGITVNPGETVVGSPPCQIFSDCQSHLYVTVTSGDALFVLTSCTTILTSSMRRLECQDAHLIKSKKCALLLETTKGNL